MRLGFLPPALVIFLSASPLEAQVPNLVPHQGRVAVNGVNFDGDGLFKFSLVNGDGSITYWSNDGTGTAGGAPAAGVELPVTKGLYSVMLGDTSVPNMTAVPSSVYTNADLRLRVWFDNGKQGFQRLVPDQRLAPQGYLPDGAITAAKLSPGVESPAIVVTGSTQNVAANTRYTATGSSNTTFNLPASAKPGDVIRIDSAGTGGITLSDPGDTVWGQSMLPSRMWSAIAASADGSTLYAVAVGNQQIFISPNAGVSWGIFGPSANWRSIACSASGAVAIAATGPQLYVSSGGGWVARGPVLSSASWNDVACSSDGTRMVAVAGFGGIYTSNDSGVTWTPRGENRSWLSIDGSADGMKLVAASYNGQLYVSSDGGLSWQNKEQARPWNSVACSANGNRMVAAETGGFLHVSNDGGETWGTRESVRDWKAVDISADGNTLVAAGLGTPIFISRDGGETWVTRESARQWWTLATSGDGKKFAAAVYNDRVHISGGQLFADPRPVSVDLIYGPDGWSVNRAPGSWESSGPHLSHLAGNVGIGTATPAYPLSFGDGNAGTRIALYDDPNGNADYGIGIDGSKMTFHVGAPGGSFSFRDAPAGSEVMSIGTGGTSGVSVKTPGNFNYPQLQLNQTTAGDWSRLRMKSDGPAWDIALGAGAAPVMNIFNGSANVLSLEHEGNAVLTRNLNFATGSGLRQMVNLWNNEHAIGVQGWATYFRTIGGASQGGFAWYRGGVHNDAQYNAGGGEELMRLNSGGLTVRGTFVSSSDRNMKENIREVDPREVLEKVVSMPVSRWNYLDDPDSEHIGPMAQDFHAAFAAGTDDKHIATVDANGVALAAIKGLNEKLGEKDREIDTLRAKNEAMEVRLRALEKAVRRLTADAP